MGAVLVGKGVGVQGSEGVVWAGVWMCVWGWGCNVVLPCLCLQAVPCVRACPRLEVVQAWQSQLIAVVGASDPRLVCIYDTSEYTVWNPAAELSAFGEEVCTPRPRKVQRQPHFGRRKHVPGPGTRPPSTLFPKSVPRPRSGN